MSDLRRLVMHSAVAAGGASASLMSAAAFAREDLGLTNVAEAAVEPLLRAALLAIDAAGLLEGERQRAALRDIIRDYLEAPAADAAAASRPAP